MRYPITSFVLLLLLYGCSRPQPLSLTPRSTSTSPFGSSATRVPISQSTSIPATTAIVAPTEANAFIPTATFPAETALPSTMTPLPTTVPSPTPAILIIPATLGPEGNEQRWRAQQEQREVFAPPLLYEARAQTALLWFDPTTFQVVEIGTLQGVFPAQAQFTFLPTKARALEVPYRINGDFGLTSISSALQERMRAAGYPQSVEAFIVLSDSVVPKP